ncbi:MAG: hypothetical protein HY447_04015 [Candidatus Omnitrophica bacterium]|nr:hypothetical protein [Candidatus Omnitrophota bacterium]
MEQEIVGHVTQILFHPMLVHFPIAFYFLELLLLVFWTAKRDEAYHRFARFSFKLGYLFMIAAMVAGYIDAGGSITSKIKPHFFSALSVFTVSTLRALFWRFGSREKSFYQPIQLTGTLVTNFLVAITGDLGGNIVFG